MVEGAGRCRAPELTGHLAPLVCPSRYFYFYRPCIFILSVLSLCVFSFFFLLCLCN